MMTQFYDPTVLTTAMLANPISNSRSTSPEGLVASGFDPTGQTSPLGRQPCITTTFWEDEGTLCFQVEVNSICVARREDNDMINGTKLLNVAGMSRGKRDGILKTEKIRSVVKVGAMHLKGVWIPFERALEFANKEHITDLLYPLFVINIKLLLYHPTNYERTAAVMKAAQHLKMLQLSQGQHTLFPKARKRKARSVEAEGLISPHTAPIPAQTDKNWSWGSVTPTQSYPSTSYVNTSVSLPVTPVTTPPAYYHRSFRSSENKQHLISYSESQTRLSHTSPALSIPIFSSPLFEFERDFKNTRGSSVSSIQTEQELGDVELGYWNKEYLRRPVFYQDTIHHSLPEQMAQKSFLESPIESEYLYNKGIYKNELLSSLSTLPAVPTIPALIPHKSDDASTINSQSSYDYQSAEDPRSYHLSNATTMPHNLNGAELALASPNPYSFVARTDNWVQRDALNISSYLDVQNENLPVPANTWPQFYLWENTMPYKDFYRVVDVGQNSNQDSLSDSSTLAYVALEQTNDLANRHQNNLDHHSDMEKIIMETAKKKHFSNNHSDFIKQNIASLAPNQAHLDSWDIETYPIYFSDMVKSPKRRKIVQVSTIDGLGSMMPMWV